MARRQNHLTCRTGVEFIDMRGNPQLFTVTSRGRTYAAAEYMAQQKARAKAKELGIHVRSTKGRVFMQTCDDRPHRVLRSRG